jgi:hypothetical protein
VKRKSLDISVPIRPIGNESPSEERERRHIRRCATRALRETLLIQARLGPSEARAACAALTLSINLLRSRGLGKSAECEALLDARFLLFRGIQ